MNNISLTEVLNNKKPRAKPKKVEVKVAKESESFLQKRVLKHFIDNYKDNHPNCHIVANPFSSVKMKSYQMDKAKEQGFKASQPDLLFLYPNKDYIGLALEIKTLEANPYYVKDKTKLKKNEHVELQKKYLDKLSNVGYYATFGVGFENCKEIIDKYFNNI